LASFAIPRPNLPALSSVKPWLTSPKVQACAAAALFLGCAGGVVTLLGPGSQNTVRVHLGPIFAHAPTGWREALGPASVIWRSEDVIRLSGGAPGAAPAQTTTALPAATAAGSLPQAPLPGLFAPGPAGPLPIIAADGRTPFQAYARPFTADGRPKVALVIGGLGLNARATQAAIVGLPPQITLSFTPYAEGLQGWIDLARAHGHEVLLETPMEPLDYPDNDPGPYTLTAGSPGPETAKKLDWILSRATGYFGLTNYLGSRFLADRNAYESFMGAVRGRGLGFIDDGSASGRGGDAPRASAERMIDSELTQPAIDQELLKLEASALQHGQALGAGFAYPVTLDKVAQWAQGVEQRGYQLAPASALATRK